MVLQKQSPGVDDEEERRRQIERNRPLSRLLDFWLEDESESPEEQRIALEKLMRGIDAEREEGHKLFTE